MNWPRACNKETLEVKKQMLYFRFGASSLNKSVYRHMVEIKIGGIKYVWHLICREVSAVCKRLVIKKPKRVECEQPIVEFKILGIYQIYTKVNF